MAARDLQGLRDEAKKWGLSSTGSQKDLEARVDSHVDTVRQALGALTHADLQRIAGDVGVATDPGQDRFQITEALLLNGVDLEQVLPDPAPEAKGKKAQEITPDGTVWMHGGGVPFHVEVGSAAWEDLTNKGYQPGEAPKDADPIAGE